MNKLKMKARSGVTLVELLVVILIVTILSVSMLPLLQPFVVESQYAAEPIPVIGNIRTKIGVYQYDKGKLPCIVADVNALISSPKLETWAMADSSGNMHGSKIGTGENVSTVDGTTADKFVMAYTDLLTGIAPTELTQFKPEDNPTAKNKHFGTLCDIDWQELKGKRSKPNHYQYLVMHNGADYAYFLGCFSDGNGFKVGTGYAVCEIVSTTTGHKYVGTWKRYKPLANNQIFFTTSDADVGDNDPKHTIGCWVPEQATLSAAVSPASTPDGKSADEALLDMIGTMETRGWEF